MTLLFVPIIAILVNTESILVALGQDAQVAKYAQTYVLTYLPGLYINGLSDCQRRLLNNFGMNRISFICGIAGMLFHTVWCYVFVVYMDLEIVGTGLANVCTQVIIFVML